MKSKDGGPAFPRHYGTSHNAEREQQLWHGGMSLRDWFAGQMLIGWLADGTVTLGTKEAMDHNAKLCYQMADAMLVAREEPTP